MCSSDLEGLSSFIFDQFRHEFSTTLRGRLAYLLLRPGIARIRRVFDYEVVGGSPLLGVRGTVIITHGRARRRMVEHAVRVGATTARERVAERIEEALGGSAADAHAAGATVPAEPDANAAVPSPVAFEALP